MKSRLSSLGFYGPPGGVGDTILNLLSINTAHVKILSDS
jgi:hypothetical protein